MDPQYNSTLNKQVTDVVICYLHVYFKGFYWVCWQTSASTGMNGIVVIERETMCMTSQYAEITAFPPTERQQDD